MGLKEYMNETKMLSKWNVAVIFVTGMFAGAVLATVWSLFVIV